MGGGWGVSVWVWVRVNVCGCPEEVGKGDVITVMIYIMGIFNPQRLFIIINLNAFGVALLFFLN